MLSHISMPALPQPPANHARFALAWSCASLHMTISLPLPPFTPQQGQLVVCE
jgi:hypothetical protein